MPVDVEAVNVRGDLLRSYFLLVGDGLNGANSFRHTDIVQETLQGKVSRIVQAPTFELSQKTRPDTGFVLGSHPAQGRQALVTIGIRQARHWIEPRPHGNLNARRPRLSEVLDLMFQVHLFPETMLHADPPTPGMCHWF